MFEVCVQVYQYFEFGLFLIGVGMIFNYGLMDMFVICGLLDYFDDSGFIDYLFVVSEVGVFNLDLDFNDVVDCVVNFLLVEDVDGEEVFFGCFVVCWVLNDVFDVILIYYFQFQDIGGWMILFQCFMVLVGCYEFGFCVFELIFCDNEFVLLEMIFDLGFVELIFVIGYGMYEEDGQCDQIDLLILLEYFYEIFLNFMVFMCEIGEDDFFNQEVCFVFMGDSNINWIIGGYYNKFNVFGFFSEFVLNYVDYVNVVLFFFGLFDQLGGLEYYFIVYSQFIEQVFFGEVGWDIMDCLMVIVGGCYYDYELEVVNIVDFLLFELVLFQCMFILEICDQVFDLGLFQVDDGVLIKFNIVYDLIDNILVYFIVFEGYWIGGFNGFGLCLVFDLNVMQGVCVLVLGQ